MPNRRLLNVLAILGLLLGVVVSGVQASAPSRPAASSPIYGPFTSEAVYPTVWNGDMRDLPQGNAGKTAPNQLFPLRLTPSERAAAGWASVLDPNAQTTPGAVSYTHLTLPTSDLV